MSSVTVEDLTREFPGGVRALDRLSLSIVDGEFFALLGPSGCGKTTLLRTIAGLERPTSGAIRIGDRDVTLLAPGARNVATVFGDQALVPHLTVAENIAHPLKMKRHSRDERAAQAEEIGGQLGLDRLMPRRPGELSGGQQQRLALARAVASRPALFLFDEPLSNLDSRLRLSARAYLKRLQRDLRVTTVFVTHDQSEALALADRLAVLEDGQVRQVGTPREVFRRPATTFVANFIGSTPMNLLPGEVHGDRVAVPGGAFELPHPEQIRRDAEAVIVGVRPEYLTLSATPESGAVSGEVSTVEHLGTSSLVKVDVGGTLVGATVPEGAEPDTGARVWLRPAPGRMLVYRSGDGTLIG